METITASRGLSIGALSRLTAVNIETIRYYERIRLFRQPPRTPGGHRNYEAEHVACLRFIRRARELGFGLAAIRSLLALSEGGANYCAEAREIAAARLADVRTKLDDLAKMESVLAGRSRPATSIAAVPQLRLVRCSKSLPVSVPLPLRDLGVLRLPSARDQKQSGASPGRRRAAATDFQSPRRRVHR